MKQTQTPDTTKQKELHTQGEWEFEQCRGNNRYEHIIFSRNGGFNGSYVIAQLGFNKKEKEPEEIKANAELIVKAVNERKALFDSHSEMLEMLETMNQWLDSGDIALSKNHRTHERVKKLINNAKNIKQ